MKVVTPTVLALALFGTQGVASAQDTMTGARVRAQLEAQGYTAIDDAEFDGMWKSDATGATAVEVDLRSDPASGDVVGKERDWARTRATPGLASPIGPGRIDRPGVFMPDADRSGSSTGESCCPGRQRGTRARSLVG